MNLLDSSGEITGVVFDHLCNTFYEKIEAGKVYLFSKFEVQRADGRYKKKLNFDWFSFMKINPKVPQAHPLHKKLKELMYLKNNLLKQTMFNCREILVE